MNRRAYRPPAIESEKCYETSALACGKTTDPPPGSYHFRPFIHLSGHFGPGMGPQESESGTFMSMTSPMLESQSYSYAGLCSNWVSFQS